MDFNLNEEQTLLSDMVNRLFEHEHDPHTRRRRLAGDTQSTGRLWPSMGELGLLGLYVPEALGGTAGFGQDSAVSSHIVGKAMGRVLAMEPFISNAVVAAGLLTDFASEQQKQWILPKLSEGSLKVVLAHAEDGRGIDLARTRTTAARSTDGYCLRGQKLGVLDAGTADKFIVSARTAGSLADEEGLSLFLVDRNNPGLRLQSSPGFDGSDIGVLRLDDAAVPADQMIGVPDAGFRPMQHSIHRGIAALLAEAVGAMDRLLEVTIEYLSTRKQFGQPLARFQALQHQIADMATALEQARSMSLMAAAASTMTDDVMRTRSIAAAKSLVGRHAMQIGKSAIQLHGGIGMTDELLVGHYVRRLMGINAMWGNADEHLAQFADGLLHPATAAA